MATRRQARDRSPVDHYYWLTAQISARGAQPLVCRTIAMVSVGFGLAAIGTLFAPFGPSGLLPSALVVALAVGSLGIAAPFLGSVWPSRTLSRLNVAGGSVGIGAGCLVQSDAFSALVGVTLFTVPAAYAVFFHRPAWLIAPWTAAVVTTGLLILRVPDVDRAALVTGTVVLMLVLLFVSFLCRVAIWIVDIGVPLNVLDPLTGLLDRDGFYEQTATLMATSGRGDDRFFTVAVVEIDGLGAEPRAEAATALVEIAAQLRGTARRGAVLARTDDIVFAFADVFTNPDSSPLVERVRSVLASSAVRRTASIGVVVLPLAPLTAEPPYEVLDAVLALTDDLVAEVRGAGGDDVRYRLNPALAALGDAPE